MTDISAAQAGTISIGDFTVNRLGLGTNRISDNATSHKLLRRAVEFDINFIDTAHRYSAGASEISIGNALGPFPDSLLVATKGGFNEQGVITGSRQALRKDLQQSLQRLETDHIKLYQLHRVDPDVPIEESIRALKQFQDEGLIRHIGLSEVTVDQLERARKVAKIVSVQNEYNVMVRHHEDLLRYCTEHDIVFIPWFPLGGLRGGAREVETALQDIAHKYNASPQQLALAWLLKRSPVTLPIPGTLSVDHLEENVKAAAIKLSDGDYQLLEAMA